MQKIQFLPTDVYVVREGDDIERVARAANVSPLALCKCNALPSFSAMCPGMLLVLPPSGNLYTVQPGDDMVTLCGSKERFIAPNGAAGFYPGQKVRI